MKTTQTPAIMVLGTSSHVGKSLLAAALCRAFARAGYAVAPFKSQNMSLNSAPTIEGLEIGRAQALQAAACGIPASIHMNPVLIKPTGKSFSQIIVQGTIWKNMSASDYHLCRVEQLLPVVCESYETLASAHDLVILEGAGSPAEINLMQHDIVNMRMAAIADASCILVGDIDRGGVFASLLGTVELLTSEDRARIKGFVINKFRGDLSLLMPGVREIELRLAIPCLGVLPFLDNLWLEEEDSLGLSSHTPAVWREDSAPSRALRIAVIAFPSLSNFTDFDSLQSEPSVSLKYCRKPDELLLADMVILPGSKETVHDLLWLRSTGLEAALKQHVNRHGLVIGICGGMQMLGLEIVDPYHVETSGDERGLGLLPIKTSMRTQKITVRVIGSLCGTTLFGYPVNTTSFHGYEIHVGETTYQEGSKYLVNLERAPGGTTVRDGACSQDERVLGTYVHGIFDDDSFRHALLGAARAHQCLAPDHQMVILRGRQEQELDRLADALTDALDMEAIFAWAEPRHHTAAEVLPRESAGHS